MAPFHWPPTKLPNDKNHVLSAKALTHLHALRKRRVKNVNHAKKPPHAVRPSSATRALPPSLKERPTSMASASTSQPRLRNGTSKNVSPKARSSYQLNVTSRPKKKSNA